MGAPNTKVSICEYVYVYSKPLHYTMNRNSRRILEKKKLRNALETSEANKSINFDSDVIFNVLSQGGHFKISTYIELDVYSTHCIY